MGFSINQPSMTAGELAEALYARVDLAKYFVGLKRCYNFLIHAHGGASNRGGFMFVDEVKDSTKTVRLIDFQFNTEQSYALEFGDQYMRVKKDGATVLEPDQNITGITQANPGVVTITSHGFSNGDEVYLSDILGMTELNNIRAIVANVTANTFELSSIDTTSYTAYSSGGTAARVFTLVTPYLEADLFLLKYFQSADTLTIYHTGYAPREITRLSHHSWQINTISYGPTISAPTGLTPTPSGSTADYVVTAVDDDGLEESVASSSVSGGATPVALSWSSVAGASKYNIYKRTNGGVYGYIGTSETVTFTDTNIAPDYTDTPQTSSNPFPSSGNYPATGTYHQQRVVSGQTTNKPERNWMSQNANFKNHNRSTPAKANDGLVFTINSKEVQEIRHYVSLKHLLTFTASGEWVVKGASSNVIDATETVDTEQQSDYGASNVPPLKVGKRVLFIQEEGSIIRDFFYKFEDDGFDGKNLSIMSEHFFEHNDVVDWAYAKTPYSTVWMVRDDGRLIGLTYLHEHDVYGWHQHETDGEFESICSIREGRQSAVYVVVKRKINGQDKRYIERMDNRIFQDQRDCFFVDSGLTLDNPINISDITNAEPAVVTATAHGLSNGDTVDLSDIEGMLYDDEDEGLISLLNNFQFTIANVTANTFELVNSDTADYSAYISGGYVRKAVTSISGLDHLEGETVAIFANANVEPQQTVTGGAITLSNPASRIHVGLPYMSEIQTLSPEGGKFSIQDKMKNIASIVLTVLKSRGFFVGPNFDEMDEWVNDSFETNNETVALHTGKVESALEGDWTLEGTVAIRNEDPIPVTIQSIMPELEVSDDD